MIRGWLKEEKRTASVFIKNNSIRLFIIARFAGLFLLQSPHEAVALKVAVTNDAQYAALMNPLKSADVLYIDDFFKTQRNDAGQARAPTAGDVNVAFELLNYRYNNKDLVTIISSEHFISELIEFDEAVGSRIYQRAKDYTCQIKRDKSRNYRLK